MCGINGIINHRNKLFAENTVNSMNASMKHRGPDDGGIHVNDRVAFGHRRLSIIDLSVLGHQPMDSFDNNVTIVFNGEIYNYKSIKKQLDYPFKSNTDTEVIIAGYLKWGINFIHQLDGMFAIALFDHRIQTTFLIRDRLGVKPLYYHINKNNTCVFASEIRSILDTGIVARTFNQKALTDYLTFQTTTGEQTLVENIFSLEPGYYLKITESNIEKIAYWNIKNKTITNESYQSATTKINELLYNSVQKRLESDVPLAAFLSGGIDSSAIVGIMSDIGVKANTFNINFDESEFSESKYATLIANKFKTNHTEVLIKQNEFIQLVPEAVMKMDVPSSDGVNTYAVSKATKEAGITVALSGVGSDEWFAGYPVFKFINNKESDKYKYIPKLLRNSVHSFFISLKNTDNKKLELLSSNLQNEDSYFAFRKLFTSFQVNKLLNQTFFTNIKLDIKTISDLSIAEWQHYLSPLLLRDADQMSMATALEIREPFLDYQLVEFVLSLPDNYKFGSSPKQLLVDSLKGILPNEIINRPKMGFVLPYAKWMKNELKEFVLSGLNELKESNYFNSDYIEWLSNAYFNNNQEIKWNMIWNLTVLGHWLKQNGIK